MSVDHNFVFLSCEIPKLEAPVNTCLMVFRSSGLKKMEPVVDELFGVFAGCTKVDQLDLFELKIRITLERVEERSPGESGGSTRNWSS